MNRKSAILLSFIVIAGCDDRDFNLAKNNYFPLQVGNYWELRPPAQDPQNDQVVVKMEITGTQSFSGVEYYLMVRKTEASNGVSVDTAYYRTDNNGFVFQYWKTGEITNPYRLGAKDGDRWQLSDASTEDDMRVTYYSTPVEINSTEVEDCRLFSFDKENWADEEHYTTLAPGIGIVTTHSAWGFRKDLKKAIVNGIEYNF